MSHIGGSKNRLRSRIERPLTRDVRRIFQPATDRIGGELRRAANVDGAIDPRKDDDAVAAIGDIVQRLFVGQNFRSAYDRDGVTPLAAFPDLLNKWYVHVVAAAVTVHHDYMKRKLPGNVFSWLAGMRGFPSLAETSPHPPTPSPYMERGRTSPPAPLHPGEGRNTIGEARNPFARRPDESDAAFLARMDDLRIFRPNPLAELDPNRQWVPMHRWNDPNGYRLSDRLWQTSTYTRTQIDRLVGQGIREGWSAQTISDAVEEYLLPIEQARRTFMPYGERYMPGGASYSGMRLARTEIARAANQAAYISAYLNPYVGGIDIARSNTGDPDCEICRAHASLGLGGERVREPYPMHSIALPVYHPQCACTVIPVTMDNPQAVTQRLQAMHEDAHRRYLYEPRVMTPAARLQFIEAMVGQALMRLLPQVEQMVLL